MLTCSLGRIFEEKNMGAKIFGPQGPPGVTSSFLRSVKMFFGNFSKQLVWLERGHQVDFALDNIAF